MPIQKEDLTKEDRQKALRYLIFIKEKRGVAIKARVCMDGTVSLEAMMMSCCIDTKEEQ